MKRSIVSLSVVGIMMLSGCGSSTSDNENQADVENKISSELVVPQAHKVERANWNDVAPIVDNFFITDDERLLSFKIKDSHIAAGDYGTEAIYIDADNNSNTGFSRGWMGNIGAEYRIEGRNLFRHSGTGWNWEFVSRVDMNVQGDEIEVEFPKTALNLSETFRATSILIDNNWRAINRTDVATYTVSGSGGDNQHQVATSIDIIDGGGVLDITLRSPNINREDFRTEAIYIDADNNPDTGFSRGWLGGIGADYRIEGNRVFRYTGTGNNWSWSRISQTHIDGINRTVPSYDKTDSTIKISINRSRVPLSSSIKVASFLLDDNYRAIESFGTTDTISLGMEAQLRSLISDKHLFIKSSILEANGQAGFVEAYDFIDPSDVYFYFIDNTDPLNPKINSVDDEFMAVGRMPSFIVHMREEDNLFYFTYDVVLNGEVVRRSSIEQEISNYRPS